MGARKHVASRWSNGRDVFLRCRGCRWESDAGDSMRSQKAAHRAHRVEMGEAPAEPRPSVFERLKAAEAALARVRAEHGVHRCEDGHVMARTPKPCVNDGYCSCGQPAEQCPTLRALAEPVEEPHG